MFLVKRNQVNSFKMLKQLHPFFETFETLMREVAQNAPVYDLGTSQRFTKEMGLVRHHFNEDTYFAGGFNPDQSLGENACDFHCDIQKMPQIADHAAGSVVCLQVLEHVDDPVRAMAEMYRILRPGGILILAVPFLASYHGKRTVPERRVFDRLLPQLSDDGHTGYGDYWRFTHEGLGLLFSNAGFNKVDVWPIDGRLITRLHILGIYDWITRYAPFRSLVSYLDSPRLGRSTTMHFVRGYKL
jgi:SAM-dependent methyltransferase